MSLRGQPEGACLKERGGTKPFQLLYLGAAGGGWLQRGKGMFMCFHIHASGLLVPVDEMPSSLSIYPQGYFKVTAPGRSLPLDIY